MKLPTINTPPGPAVTVDRWYDRKARTWVVQKKDAQGNQIGDAEFSGTRKGADLIWNQWRKEIAAEIATPGVDKQEIWYGKDDA